MLFNGNVKQEKKWNDINAQRRKVAYREKDGAAGSVDARGGVMETVGATQESHGNSIM